MLFHRKPCFSTNIVSFVITSFHTSIFQVYDGGENSFVDVDSSRIKDKKLPIAAHFPLKLMQLLWPSSLISRIRGTLMLTH